MNSQVPALVYPTDSAARTAAAPISARSFGVSATDGASSTIF